MFYHAREHILRLPDMKMRYLTFGTGARPLVMIQGLNTRGIRGSAPMLALMYRIFAREHTVYLFDRREALAEHTTVRMLAADLARVMDAMGLSDADVLGVSQGGMIAQYLAIDRPDLVHKLVLAVTLARNNETVETVIENWILLTEQGRNRELIADMTEKMYSVAYVKKYRPFLPLLTALQKPKDVRRFVTLASACLTCDAYMELEQIRCPVFVIGGRQDKVVGGMAADEIAEKLGCKIHVYEELGHAAYEEAKDFNRRVYDFLQE